MLKKVLIVEDEKPLRDILESRIAKAGFQVIPAKDGREAMALFSLYKPDLILLDVLIPEHSGLEVLEYVRLVEKSDTPIIVMSNLNQDEDIQVSLDLGVSDYMPKSHIDLRTLIIKIKQNLV